MIITRFAPSPTGFLHIGGVRTALFNWLYAKKHNGKFLLRIENTDKLRSTQEAINAILEGMKWSGLNWDGEVIYQNNNIKRHVEVAKSLLKKGKAYKCYCTSEELKSMREEAQKKGMPVNYNGFWRDKSEKHAPKDKPYTIRIKSQIEGKTELNDMVQGNISVDNENIDDFIILRSDGTPTYMLSVVVDDHDMNVSHIIRGDDHLTNTFRQLQIYKLLQWDIPYFTHIPLIHGPDGNKLSKRHGAIGIDWYKQMGYLPKALNNYLLKLGWSHGDDEIFSISDATKWFDIKDINKSASRFDNAKLEHLNSYYISNTSDKTLINLISPIIEEKGYRINETFYNRLILGMKGLKSRSRTLLDLAETSTLYSPEFNITKNASINFDKNSKIILEKVLEKVLNCKEWKEINIEEFMKLLAQTMSVKLGNIASPSRLALTGKKVSPGIFEIMFILGQKEVIKRLKNIL